MNSVDLSNCDREPIHIPGSIQPHGVLMACSGDTLTIVQVSDNVGAFFAAPPASLLRTSLGSWLAPDSAALLQAAREAGFPREQNPLSVRSRQGRRFDAIGHRGTTGGLALIEFEPQEEHEPGFDRRMRSSVRRLQDASTRQALLQTAAFEVRSLTGFDRVMVYQFDPDWHGHVVAEAKRDDLEPFLGLHYPASDIPAQARRLYTLNWLRIIPDVAYLPAKLVAAPTPSDEGALDLSFAVLRSVSPIHIEYLRNMGVTASMSVSLVHNGSLIGLIACHHYSGPHYVSFVTRETAEYLGQVLSWHVTSLDAQEIAHKELVTQRAKAALVNVLDGADSIVEGLSSQPILELTEATGAAIVYDGQVHRVGACPDEAFVRALVPLLADTTRDRVFATDDLAESLQGGPDASSWDDVAAGVLAVDISRDLGEYVLWFRPATERTVDWAGDPRKQAAANARSDAHPRLSPRGSFELWRETVRGRAVPWEPWHVTAASELRTLLLGRIRKRAAELQQLNQQLSAADRTKDEFLATVSHELRTPLNAILGWVQMLQVTGLPRDGQVRALSTIERNARSQAKLIEDLLDVSRMLSGTLRLSIEPVNVSAVVEQMIESMRLAADARDIRLQVVLDSTASVLGDQQRLQQVISNLLSNAVKFTTGGKVQVVVERLASSVEIRIADTGQGIEPHFLPHIFERFQQADRATTRRAGGLGLGLAIVKHIVELHGGTVAAFSEGAGKGSTFTVRLPLSAGIGATISSDLDDWPGSIPCPLELDGVRLLIVDDDVDARELLNALFTRCKASVSMADSVAEGLATLRRERPDVLISDIGMPDEDGYALIARVRSLGAHEGGRTPAIALTAYARPEDRARVLLAGFQNFLAKPVEPLEILAVVASIVSMRTK